MEHGMDMSAFGALTERLSNQSTQFADIPKLVWANGATIRIVGNFKSTWQHFVARRPYQCAGPNSDSCPICKAVVQLALSDDEAQQKISNDCKAAEVFFFNVLDRSPAGYAYHSSTRSCYVLSKNKGGFGVGPMPVKAFGEIVAMRKQQGQSIDPNTYDIQLLKSGSGFLTKYHAQFTGNTTPLTDEELSYTRHPIELLAEPSPLDELQAAAAKMLAGEVAPDNVDFNIEQLQKSAQAKVAGPRPPSQPPQVKMAPATMQPPAAKPQAAQAPQPQKAKLNLTAKSQNQDTTPGRDVDMTTHMEVPCSKCNANMLFDTQDSRDLECHNCHEVYDNPCNG